MAHRVEGWSRPEGYQDEICIWNGMYDMLLLGHLCMEKISPPLSAWYTYFLNPCPDGHLASPPPHLMGGVIPLLARLLDVERTEECIQKLVRNHCKGISVKFSLRSILRLQRSLNVMFSEITYFCKNVWLSQRIFEEECRKTKHSIACELFFH